MGVPKKKTGGKKKPARAPQQLTAEEHYENAEMAFAMENHDLSRTNFKRALEQEPENVEFLEGYGSFLAEVGPQSEALMVLQKAAQLAPEEGFEKYMYLGQLQEGPEAEQCMRKGIAILRRHMQQLADAPAAEAANQQEEEDAALKEHLDGMLASSLCSLVEVLMNQAQAADGPGLPAVETECESLLGEAQTLSPASPEPLQALASLRQQQGREQEALAVLRQSLALWFKPQADEEAEEGEGEEGKGAQVAEERVLATAQAIADAEAEQDRGAPALSAQAAAATEGGAAGGAGDGEEGMEGEEDEDEDEEDMDADFDLMEGDDDDQPSYEFRFEAAKLLLELDESVETATQILEQLLEENDSDPNVWLLLAMCFQGGGDLEGALGAVEEGLELCKKKLKLPSDHEAVAGFEAMQAELTAIIDAEKEGAAREAL